MRSFSNIHELDARLAELKKMSQLQEALIASSFREIKEDLQPRNLLKSSLHSLVQDAEVRKNVLEKILEITAIWAAKKWMGKKDTVPAVHLSGAGLLSEAIRMAYENKEQIKTFGTSLFNRVFNRKSGDVGDVDGQE